MTAPSLGWGGILRLGLIQAALGAIVVVTTSTLNRIMIVELALPALLPGGLVGLHYAVQLLRPRWGHGADVGGRATPWIVGGMAVLAIGGILAAASTAMMQDSLVAGVGLALLAFLLVGAGVGAAGTSLLVLLAKRVEPQRRAPAATIVWLMMIAGFAVTSASVGHLLDPFSFPRLIAVASGVAAAAFALTLVAVWRVEGRVTETRIPTAATTRVPFRVALGEVWSDPAARRFTVFIFVSMLAYNAQELLLEPFGGAALGMTPGQSAGLSGLHHGGVFAGMALVGLAGAWGRLRHLRATRVAIVGGCLFSACAILSLAAVGLGALMAPVRPLVFALGFGNGVFAVAAIGAMMGLAGEGGGARAGTRMGLWGAAQGIAFGIGGLVGTGAVDAARMVFGSALPAYASVFAFEAVLFTLAAFLSARLGAVPGGAPMPKNAALTPSAA